MSNTAQKRREKMSQQAFNMTLDIGQTLRHARRALGMNVEYISKCMYVSPTEWLEYEHNHKPVPAHIIMKLMIFGMDFWCKNRERFTETLPVPACAGMTNAATPPSITHKI